MSDQFQNTTFNLSYATMSRRYPIYLSGIQGDLIVPEEMTQNDLSLLREHLEHALKNIDQTITIKKHDA